MNKQEGTGSRRFLFLGGHSAGFCTLCSLFVKNYHDYEKFHKIMLRKFSPYDKILDESFNEKRFGTKISNET